MSLPTLLIQHAASDARFHGEQPGLYKVPSVSSEFFDRQPKTSEGADASWDAIMIADFLGEHDVVGWGDMCEVLQPIQVESAAMQHQQQIAAPVGSSLDRPILIDLDEAIMVADFVGDHVHIDDWEMTV